MQHLDEEKLIQLASKGDQPALEALLKRHETRIYAISLRMCGNREDAQDCAQESLLRIYRNIKSFKGDASFSTWTYRITMNTCLDELRRRKVRAGASLDTMLESGFAPIDPGMTPEGASLFAERNHALTSAINSLPDDMRAAIVLRDVQGFSYDEIAEILSTNVGTIKSRISRGRDKLRDILRSHKELFGQRGV